MHNLHFLIEIFRHTALDNVEKLGKYYLQNSLNDVKWCRYLPDWMTSRRVDPKEVFFVFKLSNTSLVKYFLSNDLESDASSFLKPASNFSKTCASTMALAFLRKDVSVRTAKTIKSTADSTTRKVSVDEKAHVVKRVKYQTPAYFFALLKFVKTHIGGTQDTRRTLGTIDPCRQRYKPRIFVLFGLFGVIFRRAASHD